MITWKEYKKFTEPHWIGKKVRLLKSLTTKGGTIFPKGLVMVIDRKYQGFDLKMLRRCEYCEVTRTHSISRVEPTKLELIND